MKKILMTALLTVPMLALPQAQADDFSCRGVIGAQSIDGNIFVPSGATCTLRGTQVDGNVQVARGGTLVVSGARIDGNIQSEGFRSVSVSGAHIDGNIQLKRGGSAVISRVRVDGDIQLERNRGNLRITQNVVDGNVQCGGNSPAPTGSGNRVEGNKEGQCRTL